MKTQVTFRHVNSQHPRLQEDAKSILEGLRKYSDDITSANVEFLNEVNKTVVITINLQGNIIVAKEESEDFYKSLKEAEDKIIRQIQKIKTKNIASRTKNVAV
ncbi:MAG TPA: ribosome-associated translation inhibitor RaiA [Candidatus Kapabacteria bacterium]|nr:ribosome-associated translation inhibitor RaiA [Candidatus Kapabacteria bacterium]